MARRHGIYEVPVITSKTDSIPRWMLEPDPDDSRIVQRADRSITIYLAEDEVILTRDVMGRDMVVEGAKYQHSDQIRQRFGAKAVEQAFAEARAETGDDDTAAYYEAMLKRIYGDPTLNLQHIQVRVVSFGDKFVHIYGYTAEHC